MKRCKKCGEVKPIDEFYRAAGMKDGHRSECKTCHKSRQRQWYQANRVHAIAEVKRWQQQNKEWLHEYRRAYRQRRKAEDRDAHLRRSFGITQVDYEELLARQGGGCGICGRKPGKVSLHVDHDHETGEIRVCSASGATTRSVSSTTIRACSPSPPTTSAATCVPSSSSSSS